MSDDKNKLEASTHPNLWRKCSTCKKPIELKQKYYVCSVSTCNGLRTGYVFCSVDCFERHLPGAKHREAGAVEKVAPQVPESTASMPQTNLSATNTSEAQPSSREPVRVFAKTSPGSGAASSSSTFAGAKIPREVLIIASRLKEYVQARSDYNTSAAVMDVLSEHVRVITDRAIDNARADGRKTVLDRDFDFLKKGF